MVFLTPLEERQFVQRMSFEHSIWIGSCAHVKFNGSLLYILQIFLKVGSVWKRSTWFMFQKILDLIHKWKLYLIYILQCQRLFFFKSLWLGVWYTNLFSLKRDKWKVSSGNKKDAANSYQRLNSSQYFSWYSQLKKDSTTHIAIRLKNHIIVVLPNHFLDE